MKEVTRVYVFEMCCYRTLNIVIYIVPNYACYHAVQNLLSSRLLSKNLRYIEL